VGQKKPLKKADRKTSLLKKNWSKYPLIAKELMKYPADKERVGEKSLQRKKQAGHHQFEPAHLTH